MNTKKEIRNAPVSPPPEPAKARGCRLRTSANVKAELGRTYRAFRSKEIDATDAKTRTYILQVLGAVIRDEQLATIEAQLEELKHMGLLK